MTFLIMNKSLKSPVMLPSNLLLSPQKAMIYLHKKEINDTNFCAKCSQIVNKNLNEIFLYLIVSNGPSVATGNRLATDDLRQWRPGPVSGHLPGVSHDESCSCVSVDNQE